MEVALVSVYSHDGCTLKDVAGGFGTVFEVGSSLPARALARAKSHLAELPPLVLGYLAAQLTAAGHRVRVAPIAWKPQHRDELPRADRTIVLSSIVDASAEREVVRRLSESGSRPVVIGAYATARPEHYADVAHAVIRGEPEALGASILDAPAGVIEAGDVAELDTLPWPEWSAFDVHRYRYAMLTRRGPTLPITSARGCAYGCGYCPWRVTARFRERDPSHVAREARHLSSRYGARGLSFRDPLFNLDPERVRAIAEGLRPLGLAWSAEMRADRLDGELLETLHRAGLRSLEIGVESVDRAMLSREHRKPPEREQIRDVVRTAQRLGIRVICNYLLGLPEDDEESIRATVAWAKELDSFAVQFTVATPYPGTTLEPRTAGLVRLRRPEDHTGFRPIFDHPKLSREKLAELREWAYVSYHFRPRYALRFARHAAAALLD